MTGTVEIDAAGDMKESIRVKNYLSVGASMSSIEVGVYQMLGDSYSPTPRTSIFWPGRTTVRPVAKQAQGASFSTTWLLVGGGVTTLLLSIGLLIVVRRRYRDLRHIFVKVFGETFQLLGGICMDAVNVAIHSVAAHRVLSNSLVQRRCDDAAVPFKGELFINLAPQLKIAWILFMFLTALSAITAISYRLHNLRLIRMHMGELRAHGQVEEDASETAAIKRRKEAYQFELLQTHRDLIMAALILVSLVVQGAPAWGMAPLQKESLALDRATCRFRLRSGVGVQTCPLPPCTVFWSSAKVWMISWCASHVSHGSRPSVGCKCEVADPRVMAARH
jgi:hypothetical protein